MRQGSPTSQQTISATGELIGTETVRNLTGSLSTPFRYYIVTGVDNEKNKSRQSPDNRNQNKGKPDQTDKVTLKI